MKSFSFAKALTLGCLVCLTLPVACGDDDDTTTTKPGTGGESNGSAGESSTEGGAGGAAPAIMVPGTSSTSMTIKCGTAMCTSVKTLIPATYVDPCCAGDACGIDTQFFGILGASFKDTCQATGQEGPKDAACPDSADQMLPVMGMLYSVPGFAGCCRADTGTCGVVVDDVAVAGIPLPFASPKLGCVDSAPFFANKAGAACGAGGNVGAGGGPDTSVGGAASAGASTGGAGGN